MLVGERKGKVLLVDDDVDVLRCYHRVLRPRFDIVTCESPQAALQLLEDSNVQDYDVIVSDLSMPYMDGVTFLHRVGQLEPSLVKVMMTGQACLEKVIDAVNRCNVFRFLLKPCPPELLLSTLDAAFQQRALLESERKLARSKMADQVRSRFLTCMSHEFRTPLVSIVNGCEALLAQETDLDRSQALQGIRAAGQELVVTLSDWLALSQLEFQTLEFHARECSLSWLVESIRSSLNRVEVVLAPEVDWPPRVVVDSQRITQILVTLANWMGPVGARLHLSMQPSGKGLSFEMTHPECRPSEELESLGRPVDGEGYEQFPLFQVKLYFSQQLALKLGGGLRLESSQGVGTRAVLELPLLQQGVVAAAEPTVGNVLVVEDNTVNRRIISRLLRQRGLSVREAVNGKEALELCQSERFDIVFMDLNMPVMDGLEATRAIRALAHLQKLPILALTANVFAADREASMAVGMNELVAKPVNDRQLGEVLERWLPHGPLSQRVANLG